MRLSPIQTATPSPKLTANCDTKNRDRRSPHRDRKRRQANVGAAGNANEAVAQGFVFEQDEHEDDQHDAGGLDGHPDRAEYPFDDLHGIRRRLMQLHRDRTVRAGGRGLLQGARRLESDRLPLGCSRLPESSRLPGRRRAAVREAPGLSGKLIEFAHRNVIQRLQLVLDGLLVSRQTLRHMDQLRPDDAGDRGE